MQSSYIKVQWGRTLRVLNRRELDDLKSRQSYVCPWEQLAGMFNDVSTDCILVIFIRFDFIESPVLP